MERQPQHESENDPPEEVAEALSDVQRIQRGIADALNEDRPIDDATARRIASQLHGGQTSALYSLASSGALPEGLDDELQAVSQELPVEYDSWTTALQHYSAARLGDRERRDGWAALTADEDVERDIEAARSAASRERRQRRALLERYVALGIDPGDAEAVIEFREMWQQLANAPPEPSETEQPKQEN